jgi:hypothetical protein
MSVLYWFEFEFDMIEGYLRPAYATSSAEGFRSLLPHRLLRHVASAVAERGDGILL